MVRKDKYVFKSKTEKIWIYNQQINTYYSLLIKNNTKKKRESFIYINIVTARYVNFLEK